MDTENLKTRILEANSKYRSGTPIMEDQEYDDLVEKYRSLVSESEYNKFRDSLNEGIIENGKKVIHRYIAGSLDKIKAEEPEEVLKYLKKYLKNSLCVSAKIDGLSGIAKYVNGRLVQFATRGDGTKGIDITEKAKYVKFLPKNISIEEEIYIRGELVILKTDYNKIEGTSARNIVAGLVNRKDYNKEDIENVSFISYTIMGPKYSKKEQFEILEKNGFKTAEHEFIDKNNILTENFNDILFNLANKEYEAKTDGLVLSDSEYHNEEKYRPDASVAYKINQQCFIAQLLDVEWQGPSKDGKFAPVGIVEPTEVGGVIVQKVTLNNIDFIENMKLMIGDYITIVRSGDVIPKLLSVENHTNISHKIEYPTECPCCHSILVREGPFLYCKNDNCLDKTTSQIELFIKNLDIENASFKTLKNFGICSFETLLDFKANPSYKSEMKFDSELKNKMFNKSEKDIFYAMPMKDFAKKTLKVIVEFYGWDKIKNHEIDSETFSRLPEGIGDITMNKFLDGYKRLLENVEKIIKDSRYNYKEPIEKKENNKMENNGMSICFTGALSITRNEATRIAEEHGYEVKSSVSKGLTFLVNNDINSKSSKNKKAKFLNIPIISEDEFFIMIGYSNCKMDNL